MSTKRFKIAGPEIRPIAPGHGGCIASDMITVDGKPVRYMVREEPSFEADSGWRFMAGLEDDEYVQDPTKFDIYDCNTIANYDGTIVPLLDAPVGSSFEKPGRDFIRIEE